MSDCNCICKLCSYHRSCHRSRHWAGTAVIWAVVAVAVAAHVVGGVAVIVSGVAVFVAGADGCAVFRFAVVAEVAAVLHLHRRGNANMTIQNYEVTTTVAG